MEGEFAYTNLAGKTKLGKWEDGNRKYWVEDEFKDAFVNRFKK